MLDEFSGGADGQESCDQCDPNTTVLFCAPANVVRKRWDPKTQKNVLIARPATRSEFQAWEIEKMVREAPKVEAPPSPAAKDPRDSLPASLRFPPRHPTQRSAAAYRRWPSRPGTAVPGSLHARSSRDARAARSTNAPSAEEHAHAQATASFSSWAAGAGATTVRLQHAPISATEYVSRQKTLRPMSAPLGRHCSTAGRSTHGGVADVVPAWRRSHFVGGDGGGAERATTWEEAKMRQRTRAGVSSARGTGGGTGGVSGASVNDGVAGSRGGSSVRPSTARARFSRRDESIGADASSAAGRSVRPGSARAATTAAGGAGATTMTMTTRPARLSAGTGRGGGQLPVDEALVAQLAAAAAKKKEAVRKTQPKAAAAKKRGTGAIAASLGAAVSGESSSSKEAPEPEGFKDGFRVQELIPMEGHLERMREMGRELDPRQQLWVARSMEKARAEIREAMA